MSQPFAIITGGSRGIGFAVAEYLTEKGYDLALIARDATRLAEAKAHLSAINNDIDISTHSLDLTDAEATYALIESIGNQHKKIDLLFNSAGIVHLGTSELSLEQFDEMYRTNVLGMFAAIKAVVPFMKQQGHGHIINLSSMSGRRAMPRTGCYASSKFAVSGLSEALYKELLPFGIKVSALCPSVVDTDMTRRFDMENSEKIRPIDMVHAVDYILKLGPTAATPVLEVRCKYFDVGGA